MLLWGRQTIMNRNNVSNGEKSQQGRGRHWCWGVGILSRLVREGFPEKGIFDERLEGRKEGIRYIGSWRRLMPGRDQQVLTVLRQEVSGVLVE